MPHGHRSHNGRLKSSGRASGSRSRQGQSAYSRTGNSRASPADPGGYYPNNHHSAPPGAPEAYPPPPNNGYNNPTHGYPSQAGGPHPTHHQTRSDLSPGRPLPSNPYQAAAAGLYPPSQSAPSNQSNPYQGSSYPPQLGPAVQYQAAPYPPQSAPSNQSNPYQGGSYSPHQFEGFGPSVQYQAGPYPSQSSGGPSYPYQGNIYPPQSESRNNTAGPYSPQSEYFDVSQAGFINASVSRPSSNAYQPGGPNAAQAQTSDSNTNPASAYPILSSASNQRLHYSPQRQQQYPIAQPSPYQQQQPGARPSPPGPGPEYSNPQGFNNPQTASQQLYDQNQNQPQYNVNQQQQQPLWPGGGYSPCPGIPPAPQPCCTTQPQQPDCQYSSPPPTQQQGPTNFRNNFFPPQQQQNPFGQPIFTFPMVPTLFPPSMTMNSSFIPIVCPLSSGGGQKPFRRKYKGCSCHNGAQEKTMGCSKKNESCKETKRQGCQELNCRVFQIIPDKAEEKWFLEPVKYGLTVGKLTKSTSNESLLGVDSTAQTLIAKAQQQQQQQRPPSPATSSRIPRKELSSHKSGQASANEIQSQNTNTPLYAANFQRAPAAAGSEAPLLSSQRTLSPDNVPGPSRQAKKVAQEKGPTPTHRPIKAGTSNIPVKAGTSNIPVKAGSPKLPVKSGTSNIPVKAGSSNIPIKAGSTLTSIPPKAGLTPKPVKGGEAAAAGAPPKPAAVKTGSSYKPVEAITTQKPVKATKPRQPVIPLQEKKRQRK